VTQTPAVTSPAAIAIVVNLEAMKRTPAP
jgi:hypothetical protein